MSSEKTFDVGRGGAFIMFALIAVGGAGMAILFATGHAWLPAGLAAAGALVTGALCYWMPGVLRIDDAGLAVQRRKGTPALRWDEITSATWSRPAGLAGAASDAWTINLKGATTEIILSGPMVAKPKEVQALLEAKFPRQAKG